MPVKKPQPKPARSWCPVTRAEEERLAGMTARQRNAWFDALPFTERLRRFELAEMVEEVELKLAVDIANRRAAENRSRMQVSK